MCWNGARGGRVRRNQRGTDATVEEGERARRDLHPCEYIHRIRGIPLLREVMEEL